MFLARLNVLTAPLAGRLRLGRTLADLPAETLHPAEVLDSPPAFFDPRDWDRVTAVEAGTNVAQERARLDGGPRHHGPTLRYRVRDALATPHGIFAADAALYRNGPLPLAQMLQRLVPRHRDGFYAGSPLTPRYFGHWLYDGLATTLLCGPDQALFFPPFPASQHAIDYARLLDLGAIPADWAAFRTLSFCDDRGMNSGRMARLAQIHARIQRAVPPSGHPGVFIRRGTTGVARVLLNEDAVADALAARGFAICHATDPLDRILGAGAAVQTVVCVEGSHGVHGMFAARRGALIATINPADRFNNVFADILPAFDQRLATIVADRDGAGYRVDIPRLLALIDGALDRMG